jgi:hypothetical protein
MLQFSTRRRGRPRVAAEVQEVSLLLPQDVYDLYCREALSRDVSIAQVLRERIVVGLAKRKQ